MTEERILIPEKIYVGMPRKNYGRPVPNVSMTAWGSDSSGKSRMQTVDNNTISSLTLDNTSLHGFMMSGNNRGDEWCIQDPRGFSTLVPAGNFSEVIKHSTIVNGVIAEPCVWGRSTGNNVLLNTTSNLYQLALLATQVSNSKETWRAAKPGNRVTLTNGLQGIYLGKFYSLTSNVLRSQSTQNFVASEKSHHVIVNHQNVQQHWRKRITNEIHWMGSPKLARIDQRDEITPAEAEQQLNLWLQDDYQTYQAGFISFMASSSKFDHMPTIVVEPHEKGTDLIAYSYAEHATFVEITSDRVGVLEFQQRNNNSFSLKLIDVNLFKTTGRVDYLLTQNHYGQTTFSSVVVEQKEVQAVYQLRITYETPHKNIISRLV